MKIKILQPITTVKGELKPGDVVEVKPKVALKWIEHGKASK